MRSLLPMGSILLAFASGCWGATQNEAPRAPEPVAESAPPAAVPSWVPSLTAQQRELLKPISRPVQTPAVRVFPDLARFGYAPSRPLRSGEDALKFAKMVTQVLNDSPRFYSLGEAPADAANLAAQYGPAADLPDGFAVAKPRADGLVDLSPVPGANEARAALAKGDKLAQNGDVSGAISALRDALAKSPSAPATHVSLATALINAGRTAEAETVLREAVKLDTTYAPAHLVLAEMAERRGDITGARREVIEALAYHPSLPSALALAGKLGAGERNGGWLDAGGPSKPSGRIAPMRVFLDVDDKGAIHVATGKSDAAQIYGGCRAIMRFEPDVRAQLFKQPREVPYYLSMGEEVVCLEAAIGAYLAAKSQGQPPSQEMEALAQLALTDGLSGYVMFEILGESRAERARTAPADVHRDVAQYIDKHVLSGAKRPAASPNQPYTAAR